MTREEVKRLLMTMEAIYPNFKIRDLQITLNAWFEILEDQDPKFIFAALKNYSRTNATDFAPSVGQLIQGAYDIQNGSNNNLTPGEAWSMVYKALCRATYYAEDEFNKFPEEVKKAVGSPSQLRAWAQDSSFNEGVASSNFRKAYSSVCERKKYDALMAPEIRIFLQQTDVKSIEG